MTTGLFMLRAVQIGLTINDLDGLEYGTVVDMLTEAGNDDCNYRELATQEDFDRF
jgi:hypothetical protein